MAYLGTKPANQVIDSTLIADGTITTSDLANQAVTQDKIAPSAQYMGFKNRIINGDMCIDQRNAGASVTPVSGQYYLDRWYFGSSQASKLTAQQNQGSVTPPTGFTNYFGFTSSSAYSILSTDYFLVEQPIEGLNCSDLAWGTANASAVTLSFLVRSSLTGTFGGAIRNSAANRSYPFSYTISSANTWEQKSITIAGDTTGTWLTTNGIGIRVAFSLGSGSTYNGTAGSWSGSNLLSATGATSVVGTNGATFYITGVQVEKGTTATSFDYRPYGTELALCQRYFQIYGATSSSSASPIIRVTDASNEYYGSFVLPVTMRATPTASVTATQVHKPNVRYDTVTSVGAFPITEKSTSVYATPSINDTNSRMLWYANGVMTFSAEL